MTDLSYRNLQSAARLLRGGWTVAVVLSCALLIVTLIRGGDFQTGERLDELFGQSQVLMLANVALTLILLVLGEFVFCRRMSSAFAAGELAAAPIARHLDQVRQLLFKLREIIRSFAVFGSLVSITIAVMITLWPLNVLLIVGMLAIQLGLLVTYARSLGRLREYGTHLAGLTSKST